MIQRGQIRKDKEIAQKLNDLFASVFSSEHKEKYIPYSYTGRGGEAALSGRVIQKEVMEKLEKLNCNTTVNCISIMRGNTEKLLKGSYRVSRLA